jgi:hypothetical protein
MEVPRKSPGAAFLLSVVPGVGHIYAGRTGAGVGWLVAVVVGYNAFPPVGLFLHFLSAATAAQAAQAANRSEAASLDARRESAEDVARLLDEAAARRGAAAPAAPPPPETSDPAPRVMRAAFPVEAALLVRSLADAMGAEGLLVLGVDAARGRVRASADAGGGRFTYLTAQVEPTPSGSRVRILVDRPPGTAEDAEGDDDALRAILERTERLLRPPGAASVPLASAVRGEGEALTEDHFLEQLREAWESFEQGWMPEPEWLQRKRGLVAGVTLRPGTRRQDLLAACRPLAEAGVLDADDLRALETRLG